MLDVQDLTVRFGGVTALNGVGLSLEPGQIVSVIGPNGSGKSTLFNGISGFVSPAEGVVRVEGTDVTGLPAYRRARLGVARTFQTPRVDFQASVLEAVLCGFFPSIRSGMLGSLLHSRRVRREERRLLARGRELLESFGLEDYAAVPLSELPMGRVRMVDVARGMAMEPTYLLLDEPAAGLTGDEQEMLVRAIRKLAADGVGVLFVEHNFGLVKGVSENVVVLNRGEVIARGAPAEVAAHPRVIDAYLGTGNGSADKEERS